MKLRPYGGIEMYALLLLIGLLGDDATLQNSSFTHPHQLFNAETKFVVRFEPTSTILHKKYTKHTTLW